MNDPVQWGQLDEEAMREAKAIKKLKHHASSVFQVQVKATGVVQRDQMVWDECLEIHFVHCEYCGRLLKEGDNPNRDDVSLSQLTRISVQDIDMCSGCRFLHGIIKKSQSRQRD